MPARGVNRDHLTAFDRVGALGTLAARRRRTAGQLFDPEGAGRVGEEGDIGVLMRGLDGAGRGGLDRVEFALGERDGVAAPGDHGDRGVDEREESSTRHGAIFERTVLGGGYRVIPTKQVLIVNRGLDDPGVRVIKGAHADIGNCHAVATRNASKQLLSRPDHVQVNHDIDRDRRASDNRRVGAVGQRGRRNHGLHQRAFHGNVDEVGENQLSFVSLEAQLEHVCRHVMGGVQLPPVEDGLPAIDDG